MDVEDLKNKQRYEVQEHLIERSREAAAQGRRKLDEARRRVAELYDGNDPEPRPSAVNGRLSSLSDWLRENCRTTISAEEIGRLSRDELERRLRIAVEERYRPEMLKMERILVLQILDEAWKNHLLVMDHLRSSVGLRGYAQVDPKVEYKREGMRTFESMWDSVGSRVTDFVFRMEQLSEDFVSSTWAGAEARHEESPVRPARSRSSSRKRSTARKRAPIANRSATASRKSAATTLAPAAAERSTKPATGDGIKDSCLSLRESGDAFAERKTTIIFVPTLTISAWERTPDVPYLLNVVYLALLISALPWLAWQAVRKGKYREGFAAKFLGRCVAVVRVPPALCLAPRRKRGRSSPAGRVAPADHP